MLNPHKKLISFDIVEFTRATNCLLRSIAIQEKWKKPSKTRRRVLHVVNSAEGIAKISGKFSIIDATLLFGLVYFDFDVPKATNFLTRFFAFVDMAEADGVMWDELGDDEPGVTLPEDTLEMAANLHPEALQDFMVEDIHDRAKRLKRKYLHKFKKSRRERP
ncbi:MAG: hypothetical protein KDI63_17180 [Gammaproteobacteria bacterium]|nr:hypothetical protein [Gammaproteobacteria bacterium]